MCNCVVDVTAKVATHLESKGVEIVGTPVMDAALMLDSMQLTTSTRIHYVQKVVNKKGEKHVKKSAEIAAGNGNLSIGDGDSEPKSQAETRA